MTFPGDTQDPNRSEGETAVPAQAPEVGQINFGGGVAEQYLGDGGWQIFREDERTCPLLRYGNAHEAHDYRYVYTRPTHLGGITSGRTYCDGLDADTEPYPLCPLAAELRATEGDLGVAVQVAAERADEIAAAKADRDAHFNGLRSWRSQAIEAQRKIRAVEMVRCWRNEDDRQFVFADDLWAALGVGAATGTKGDTDADDA